MLEETLKARAGTLLAAALGDSPGLASAFGCKKAVTVCVRAGARQWNELSL